MRSWLASILADVAALRATWRSVCGGWRTARRDASDLIAHRRVLVDTSAMMQGEMRVVLRTRLRLMGDTQTDILRSWLEASSHETADTAIKAHFAAVTAACSGWAAARAMERLLSYLVVLVGAISGMMSTVQTILTTQMSDWIHGVLSDWRLWSAIALVLFGGAVRWGARRWLRSVFSRGLA